MIPVSLIIKGLYSYQEPQKIEFNKLIEGQLFGIFGSVGSGKSSILEAISFALYGETERLNQRDSRNYNMMNLKSDDLLIDFQFKNFDREEYRFTVRGKRNSKDFLKVNTFDRAAYKLVDGNWEPLESTLAESILGLSYKNFRRTIIIPQGKFQEFLQLGDSDRTKMLKEIFHLDKYEYYYQTLNLEKKNNDALQNLNGQLSHYVQLNQELISLKEAEVKKLEETNNQLKIQILEKDLLYKEQQNLKNLYDERKQLQEKLDDLVAAEEDIQKLEKKLRDYEYCLVHFKDLLKRKQEIGQTIQEKKAELERHTQSYDANIASLEVLEKEGIKIKSDFQKQDIHKESVADYQLALSLMELKAEKEQLEKRILDGQVYVDKVAKDRSDAQEKLDKEKKKRASLRLNLPDMGKLVNIRAWFDKKDQLTQDTQKHKSKLQNLNIQLTETIHSIQKQLKNPLLPGIQEGVFPDYHGPEVRLLRKQLQLKQEDLQKQISHHTLQRKLGEFSTQLENGEACMLCGSIDHPQILKVEDVESHLLEAHNQLKEIREQDQAFEAILHELSKLIFQEQSVRQQLGEVQMELDHSVEVLLHHERSFIWDDFSPLDPGQVSEAFQIAKKTQQELETIDDDIQVLEHAISKNSNDYERFGQVVNSLKIQLKGKESESHTLANQLRGLSLKDINQFSQEGLQQKVSDLKKKIELEKERFDKWTEQNTILNDQKIALKERVEFAKHRSLIVGPNGETLISS